MRSWVGIEEGKEERSAYCVMMNVRVLVMLSGSVQSTEMTLCVDCSIFFGIDRNVFRAWIVFCVG